MEWLPVLSPDGKTMVYSRSITTLIDVNTAYALRVAAVDGSGDRELFGQPPSECRSSTGRPAWIPGTDELVTKCWDGNGELTLVRTDVRGKVLDVYEIREPDRTKLDGVGDPTVSPDGQTIVIYAARFKMAREGSLYAIDIATKRVRPLLTATKSTTYSDPVFSSEAGILAYRKGVGGKRDYEVIVANLESGVLNSQRAVSGGAPGKDQDPTFSPDGSQVLYVHSDPDKGDMKQQRLYIANSDGSGEPRDLQLDGLPRFQSVPAWSRR